jgi:hypothetical protein
METIDGKYYKISSYKELVNQKTNPNSNNVFYISDFEEMNDKTGLLQLRAEKPLTSIFNQNILPQEGLFLFNPDTNKAMEDIFNTDWDSSPNKLLPFECFNIHKDLADYINRKIAKYGITKKYIYPQLSEDVLKIKDIEY